MSKTIIAIIGGTGLNTLPGFTPEHLIDEATHYGNASSPIQQGTWNGQTLQFIARHGDGHTIPPHLINYRANMAALKAAGATHVIAVNAVGSIAKDFPPGSLCIPSDILDYTYDREHTYSDGSTKVEHIEFAPPYEDQLTSTLVTCSTEAGIQLKIHGVHGVTQGPRLETAAEINRMERDGCDLVGMTGMPEAALAKEAGLAYACIAVSVNWAAGKNPDGGSIHAEIEQCIAQGMSQVITLLQAAIPHIQ